MQKVIEEAVLLAQKKQPCVLATVVRTKGMTPQKAGAKLLIRQDGSSLGTLGGGCVEGDIWHYAKQMLADKSKPQLREYYLNEDIAAKDGLVCGGTMYFYLEPLLLPEEFLNIAREIVLACTQGPPLAVATVVSGSEEAVEVGQKIVVKADGSVKGALKDSELQRKIAEVGAKIAVTGEKAFLESENGTGVYVEGFTTPPTLVIMGGGHIGKSVYQLALPLGFKIIVVDDRPEFSNAERFPQAAATLVADFDQALKELDLNYNTFILVATRGHRFDDLATKAAVQTPARYVGLLGSKRKNLLIFRDLLESGIALEKIQEIHAPVGLNIGALMPEELAVSILAEIIMCMRGGDGSPMKMSGENLLDAIQKLPTSKKTPLPS